MSANKPGTEFLLEVLHDGEPVAEVERPVTARATLPNPAVRESVSPGEGLHFAKKLASLHLTSIEHFCSIHNLGILQE